MIKNFHYYFTKNLYFRYLLLSIGIFIFFKKTLVINYNNLIPVIFTILVVYVMVSLKNENIENNFNKYSIIYKNFDYDKYPNIKNDSEIILILSDLKELFVINKIEFRNLLENIDLFLNVYNRLNSNNPHKDQLYSNLYELSQNILNILNSFSVNFSYSNLYINDREIDTKIINSNIKDYKLNILKIRNWLSKKLTYTENINNNKWLNKDINMYSSPIYPDDISPNEYNLTNYNVY